MKQQQHDINLRRTRKKKKSESQMGFEPTTLRDLDDLTALRVNLTYRIKKCLNPISTATHTYIASIWQCTPRSKLVTSRSWFESVGRVTRLQNSWSFSPNRFFMRRRVYLRFSRTDGCLTPGADVGGGCRGCAPPPPPPEMTCGFLIQLVFCKKKNYVVYWC